MGQLNNSQNFVVPQGGGGGGRRFGAGVMSIVAQLMGRKAAQDQAIVAANLDVATYGRKKSIDADFHRDKTDITLAADKEKISHKDASGAAAKIYTERESAKTTRRHFKETNKITNKGRLNADGTPVNPSDWNPGIQQINDKGVTMQRTGQKNRTPVQEDTNTPPGGGNGNGNGNGEPPTKKRGGGKGRGRGKSTSSKNKTSKSPVAGDNIADSKTDWI